MSTAKAYAYVAEKVLPEVQPQTATPAATAIHTARQARRLQHLVNNLPTAVIVLDERGYVAEANPVAISMLGEPLIGSALAGCDSRVHSVPVVMMVWKCLYWMVAESNWRSVHLEPEAGQSDCVNRSDGNPAVTKPPGSSAAFIYAWQNDGIPGASNSYPFIFCLVVCAEFN